VVGVRDLIRAARIATGMVGVGDRSRTAGVAGAMTGVGNLPRAARDTTAVLRVWDGSSAAHAAELRTAVGDCVCGTRNTATFVAVRVVVLARITILRSRISASAYYGRDDATAVLRVGDGSISAGGAVIRAAVGDRISGTSDTSAWIVRSVVEGLSGVTLLRSRISASAYYGRDDATAVVGVWDGSRAARAAEIRAAVGDRIPHASSTKTFVAADVVVLSRTTILRPRIPASTRLRIHD
jgi:hypothetical protein